MHKILNSANNLEVTVSKTKSDVKSTKETKVPPQINPLAESPSVKEPAKAPEASSTKKVKDWVVTARSVQKSRSPAPVGGEVSRRGIFPLEGKPKRRPSGEGEMPTLHIPGHADKCLPQARVSHGHPGLPNGLLAMTSSLIHNSKSITKMVLKETKAMPLLAKREAMLRKLEPLNINNEPMDGTVKPLAQVPAKQLDDNSFSKSIEKSLESESGSRSRLQLKPATSPKLRVEDYAMVPPPATTTRVLGTPGRPKLGTSSALTDLADGTKKISLGDCSGGSKGPVTTVEKKVRKERRSGAHLKPTPLVPWSKRSKDPPRNSGGWSWKGPGFVAKVHLNNEEVPVDRICYVGMRHEEGDEEVAVKDCILLASGTRKKDLPYVAKVNSLWENPEDGEMMMSLLWFYRPEHTDIGRQEEDCSAASMEVFASKHRDHTSVACIEDKCFVMTFNEYCRYMKFSAMVDGGVSPPWNIVPERSDGYPRGGLLPSRQVAHDRVFLCRKVYDSRGKRMIKNPY